MTLIKGTNEEKKIVNEDLQKAVFIDAETKDCMRLPIGDFVFETNLERVINEIWQQFLTNGFLKTITSNIIIQKLSFAVFFVKSVNNMDPKNMNFSKNNIVKLSEGTTRRASAEARMGTNSRQHYLKDGDLKIAINLTNNKTKFILLPNPSMPKDLVKTLPTSFEACNKIDPGTNIDYGFLIKPFSFVYTANPSIAPATVTITPVLALW